MYIDLRLDCVEGETKETRAVVRRVEHVHDDLLVVGIEFVQAEPKRSHSVACVHLIAEALNLNRVDRRELPAAA